MTKLVKKEPFFPLFKFGPNDCFLFQKNYKKVTSRCPKLNPIKKTSIRTTFQASQTTTLLVLSKK